MSKAREAIVNRLKKKEPVDHLQKVLTLVKTDRLYDALEHILGLLDNHSIAKYIYSCFIKSPYKSYHEGMKSFKICVDDYLKTSNRAGLIFYQNSMKENNKTNSVNWQYSDFDNIRYSVLELFLNKNYMIDDTITVIEQLNCLSEDEDNFYKKHIANLAAIKWPNNTGIKILFGSNK